MKYTSAMQAYFQWFVHDIFAPSPTAAEVKSNDEVQILQISVEFQISYLKNKFQWTPYIFAFLVQATH